MVICVSIKCVFALEIINKQGSRRLKYIFLNLIELKSPLSAESFSHHILQMSGALII